MTSELIVYENGKKYVVDRPRIVGCKEDPILFPSDRRSRKHRRESDWF